MTQNPKKLPKILYDQTQFTGMRFLAEKGFWLQDQCYWDAQKISGYVPDNWILYTQNKPVSFWFGAYDQEALDEEARVGFINFTDPKFVKRFEDALEASREQTERVSKDYFKNFYGKEAEMVDKEPHKVVEFLKGVREANASIMGYYFLTQPQRFYEFDAKLKALLPNADLELIATSGPRLTYISELNRVIIDIARKVRESGLSYQDYRHKNPPELKNLDDALGKVRFLNWGFFGGDLVDENYLERKIGSLVSDTKKFEQESEKMKALLSAISKRTALLNGKSVKGSDLADIMGYASILRFDLQTCTLSLLKYIDNFIKLAQKKYDLSSDEIASYYAEEILDLIENGTKPKKELLEERQKGFLMVLSHKGIKRYIGSEALTRIKDLLDFRSNEIRSTKETKGVIASWPDKKQKIIEGRAFVMTTAFEAEKDLKQFRDGDILIATQTHPNLVPQMKKALAIVTDEGGITCHAAIVSRELGKFCIIGTRLSTKIFKTGDRVSIDCEKGTVIILK